MLSALTTSDYASSLFLAIPILLLGFLGGCVWPADSTATGNNQQNIFPYNAGYDVHRRFPAICHRRGKRWLPPFLLMIRNTIRLVSRFRSLHSRQWRKSVRRHPILTLPPVYDSAVPYHVSGSANFVTLVYSSLSKSPIPLMRTGLQRKIHRHNMATPFRAPRDLFKNHGF